MPDHSTPAAVITVLNLKGGVGKTHAVWLLASVCEERGKRCLLIDTDPQGNLSNSFARERGNAPGVEQFLDPSCDADASSLIRRTAYPHVDIIPASPQLARFDVADQRTWERSDLHLSFREGIDELRPLYDVIVFDCPPRLSLVSFAALVASDHVIVPLESADWGAQGIVQVTEAVRYVQSHYNASLELLGYVISRFKPRRVYQQTYLTGLRELFGESIFDTVITDLAAFERAVTDAVPITRHAPRSAAAKTAREFFDEVCGRIAKLGSGGKGGPRPNRRVRAGSAA